MPFNPEPFDLLSSLQTFVLVFFGSTVLVLALASVLAFAGGGFRGVSAMFGHIGDGTAELVQLSFRRIWALGMLTFRESVRRKVLLVFVVFIVLFMFAGWFMGNPSQGRVDLEIKKQISFTLRTTSWLMLPVMLLLSCWGLPEDIKARTLHTVVTKPARRMEIVLGRMLGFVAIGTLILLLMGGVGYVWVIRQVPDEAHKENRLASRVPVYGQLSFISPRGNEVEKGVNVGDIWDHRSFIHGGSKARAVWIFEGITPDMANEDGSLRIESSFEAFRTHKGNLKEKLSIFCQYWFVIEETGQRVATPAFQITEFGETLRTIKPKLDYTDDKTKESRTAELFGDIIRDGKLRVEVACIDSGQFLGMARPDLFIRLRDRSFLSGFSKSIFGTWLEMVLVVLIGVAASCFLRGSIATLLTFGLYSVGKWFRGFLESLTSGEFTGGGPFESLFKIPGHMNIQSHYEGPGAFLIEKVDFVVLRGLWMFKHAIPNFEHFTRLSQYAPNGFDVSWNSALLPCMGVTLAFLLPSLLVGYYSLKLRELEVK